MKRTLKIALLLAVIMFAGYNFHLSNNETEGMSDTMLANVEALAREEWGNGTCYWEQLYTRCTPTRKTQIGCPYGALGYND